MSGNRWTILAAWLMVSTSVAGCYGEGGSDIRVDRVGYNEFRVSYIGDIAAECDDDHRPVGDERMSPDRDYVLNEIGEGDAEFIVLMDEQLDPEEYPLKSRREDPDRPGETDSEAEALWHARAEATARLQACAIAEVEMLGGRYLSSFILANAFLAEMDVDQAAAISLRKDVRWVEYGLGFGEPPP